MKFGHRPSDLHHDSYCHFDWKSALFGQLVGDRLQRNIFTDDDSVRAKLFDSDRLRQNGRPGGVGNRGTADNPCPHILLFAQGTLQQPQLHATARAILARPKQEPWALGIDPRHEPKGSHEKRPLIASRESSGLPSRKCSPAHQPLRGRNGVGGGRRALELLKFVGCNKPAFRDKLPKGVEIGNVHCSLHCSRLWGHPAIAASLVGE